MDTSLQTILVGVMCSIEMFVEYIRINRERTMFLCNFQFDKMIFSGKMKI